MCETQFRGVLFDMGILVHIRRVGGGELSDLFR